MMKVEPSRRVERAALRRGPAWRTSDVLLLLAFALLVSLAVWAPAILADAGDTQIGTGTYLPELGGSLSSVLLAAGRWAVVALIGVTLWFIREAPITKRVSWLLIACGLLMNYSRNVYTGSPATLSFLLIQLGLVLLLVFLSVRPTVWQREESWRYRAERAEAELKRWRGDE